MEKVLEYASDNASHLYQNSDEVSVTVDSFALEYWLSAGSLPRNSAGGLTDWLIMNIALWMRP